MTSWTWWIIFLSELAYLHLLMTPLTWLFFRFFFSSIQTWHCFKKSKWTGKEKVVAWRGRRDAHPASARSCEAVCKVRKAKTLEGPCHTLPGVLAVAFLEGEPPFQNCSTPSFTQTEGQTAGWDPPFLGLRPGDLPFLGLPLSLKGLSIKSASPWASPLPPLENTLWL